MGKIEQISLFKISKFWFFKSALLLSNQFWANILYVWEFFWAKSLQKTCLYVHEKLQRNPSVGSCLKFFTFLPYGFDYLGFLTNARRGAMRSKTQWVIYRGLDWWPGPQKVQFGEIAGYPEVVQLCRGIVAFDLIWPELAVFCFPSLWSPLCAWGKKFVL